MCFKAHTVKFVPQVGAIRSLKIFQACIKFCRSRAKPRSSASRSMQLARILARQTSSALFLPCDDEDI